MQELSTYTKDRTSNRAAPSVRSEAAVTGLARSKVARNARNALSSLRCASDIVDVYRSRVPMLVESVRGVVSSVSQRKLEMEMTVDLATWRSSVALPP